MTIRTQLKAGKLATNHNDALQVRTALKAGGRRLNHNEALQVRTALKAGGFNLNHNETVRVPSAIRETEQPPISMRKQIRWTGSKQDRLELLIVRAGLRAGLRSRPRARW